METASKIGALIRIDVEVFQPSDCVRAWSNMEAHMAPLFVLTLRFGKRRELTLAIWLPLM